MDMFGGQSHPNFDNDMAIFIEPTRQEVRDEWYDVLKQLGYDEEKINDEIEYKLEKRVHQAMQGVVYN